MTTKYTYILYTGAVEAGGLSEANKAASGGECVGWLRLLLLLLFLFVMTARRSCSSYSVILSPGGVAWIWRWNRGSDMRWWFAGHLLPVCELFKNLVSSTGPDIWNFLFHLLVFEVLRKQGIFIPTVW